MYKIIRLADFIEWFDGERRKDRDQITDRLESIEKKGHFGPHKRLDADIWELKWGNGRRVYYAYLAKWNIIILLGGNKNGQDKDIRRANYLYRRYAEEISSPQKRGAR